jgi:hypothetical protein
MPAGKERQGLARRISSQGHARTPGLYCICDLSKLVESKEEHGSAGELLRGVEGLEEFIGRAGELGARGGGEP